ncbi:MAG TPA: hypothetical protein ENI86_05575 [Acidimicrobiales bacterium]|nr:hypothetical protein [Acidimicrobiales bacterium]
MELNNIWGLPSHPLLVHLAVVLLPMAVIGAAVLVFIPRLRSQSWGLVILGLTFVAVVSVGLAQGSGEEFGERVQKTDLVRAHIAMGESVSVWAILLGVGVAALVLVPWAQKLVSQAGPGDETDDVGPPKPGWLARLAPPLKKFLVDPVSRFARPIAIAALVLTLIGGVGSAIQIVRVGHSGAAATWERVNGD